MPIYAYRCTACGHAQDVLQKMSDALLTQCPACGAEAYVKQVTAAGFQLKGSGWYVTDFRGGNTGAKKEAKEDGQAEGAPKADDKAAPGAESNVAKSADKAVDGPADKKTPEKVAVANPAPAPAPGPSPSPPPSSGS
ncbi:MAG TPA: FmdB family zinc ribbon protein [Rubrivivax sp.]|nr:FmdB family zinc ribbon protein [Rubrivivax sp.]